MLPLLESAKDNIFSDAKPSFGRVCELLDAPQDRLRKKLRNRLRVRLIDQLTRLEAAFPAFIHVKMGFLFSNI